MKPRFELLTKIFFCSLMLTISISAQTTAFTYQGNLQFSGQPANGNFDFEFALFDAAAAGTQLGATQTVNSVAVSNGAFSVSIDFGSQFPGASRFIEIRVRPAGGGAFTPLAPRQSVASSPYAIRSATASVADTATNATNAVNATNATTAATATNALSLGGVFANQYVLTGDARLSDARTPTAGSPNYIQNTATQQASSNFNISGDGTAGGTLSGNIVNATTQFNLGGSRILISSGGDNLFAGIGAGAANLSGAFNSFFGNGAGIANSTGGGNSFFGLSSGLGNTVGFSNSFFGRSAGDTNTSGSNNSFFGMYAGTANQTGSFNSFFGAYANPGANNLSNATAIGYRARVNQSDSLVLGSISGINGATADTRVGIGTTTPAERLHVVGNTLLTGNLSAATLSATSSLNLGGSQAIRRAGLTTLELGDDNDSIRVLASNTRFGLTTSRGYTDIGNHVATIYGFDESSDFFSPALIGRFARGTRTSPTFPMLNDDLFTLGGSGWAGSFWVANSSISKISFTATEDWTSNTWGSRIDFYTAVTGTSNVFPTRIASMTNTGIGIRTTTPTADLHIVSNGGDIVLGDAGCPAGSTAIGFNGAFNNCLNYSVRGDGTALYFNRPTGGDILFREENGTTQLRLRSGGVLQLTTLGTAGSTALCRNASSDISTCSSSLRYKKNIAPFAPGMSFVRQLRPIAYEWIADSNKDVGFGAEDVAKIDPRFVTYNDKGEVEGIKYDRLSVAFVNAFREQQAEIEDLRTSVKAQNVKIDQLVRILCELKPESKACGKN